MRFWPQLVADGKESNVPPRDSHDDQDDPLQLLCRRACLVSSLKMSIRLALQDTAATAAVLKTVPMMLEEEVIMFESLENTRKGNKDLMDTRKKVHWVMGPVQFYT